LVPGTDSSVIYIPN